MDAKLQDLATRFDKLLGALKPDETQAGFPGRWSVQQIVEHLSLTYASTAKIVLDRLEKGRPTQSRPSLGQHSRRLFVVRFGYFPGGVTAPLAVTPSSSSPQLSGAVIALHATAGLHRLDQMLDQAADRFGEQTRSVSHFILGPLNPGEWRRFHHVHGLHHLRQIEEIRRQRLGSAPASQQAGPLHR